MTISTTTTPYHNYTGNGSVDDFAVTNFKILRNSDNTHAIQVYKTVIDTGIATLLAETTDYTVALDSTSPSTGTVTLVAGNLPSTHRISIIPSLPKSQEVNLQNAAVIDVEDIESALDKLTLIVQSNQEQLSRAIVFGEDTLERNTQMSNLTSDQVENLVTQLNTLASSENVSDFSINALSAATEIDTAADFLAFHDTSSNTMKKILPDNLGLGSNNLGDVLDVQFTNITGTETINFTTANTWIDVTGMSISTTPDAKTDTVIIGGLINIGADSNSNSVTMRVVRSDGKIVGVKNKLAGAFEVANGYTVAGDHTKGVASVPFLLIDDIVGVTSTLTYKVQVLYIATGNVFINRDSDDANSSVNPRLFSQINLIRLSKSDNTGDTFTNINIAFSDRQQQAVTNSDFNNLSAQWNALSSGAVISAEMQNTSAKLLILSSICGGISGGPGWGLQLFNNGDQVGTFTSSGDRKKINSGLSHGSYTGFGNKFLNYIISPAGAQCNIELRLSSTSNMYGSGSFYYDLLGANTSPAALPSSQSHITALSLNTTKTGSPWKQIVTTTNSAATSTSVADGVKHSLGTAVTITPQSASSTLLVTGHLSYTYDDASAGVYGLHITFDKDGSNLFTGATAGSRSVATSKHFIPTPNSYVMNMPIHLMVAAGNTSATTITPQVFQLNGGACDIFINRTGTDTDSTGYFRNESQMSIIEILPN